jgi:hypothetical protein
MPNSNQVYIALLHGRNSPDEALKDWGFNGPVIGPVVLHWTYGTMNVHSPALDAFEELREAGGMVVYGGKYFGDLDILTHEDGRITEAAGEGELHDFAAFERNSRTAATT